MSFHGLSLPEPGFTALLGELISTTIDSPIDLSGPVTEHTGGAGSVMISSRREAILIEAAKLFACNGFTSVSMDDVGAAVGIAGPSVYNHFPPKSDILAAAMFRGDEWLRMGMTQAFARATDERDALRRLLRSYAAFAFENPDLIQLLISEAVQLPEPDRHRARSAQHSYVTEWVHLADEVHPAWDPTTEPAAQSRPGWIGVGRSRMFGASRSGRGMWSACRGWEVTGGHAAASVVAFLLCHSGLRGRATRALLNGVCSATSTTSRLAANTITHSTAEPSRGISRNISSIGKMR